jgi:hypothetical protein
VEQATRVLLRLLGQQIQLRNVYTHHPAVLYWVFSSSWIHPSLQKGVVRHELALNVFTHFPSLLLTINASVIHFFTVKLHYMKYPAIM